MNVAKYVMLRNATKPLTNGLYPDLIFGVNEQPEESRDSEEGCVDRPECLPSDPVDNSTKSEVLISVLTEGWQKLVRNDFKSE